MRDRWWGRQRGPSLLDRTAKHSILYHTITLKVHRKMNPRSNLWGGDAEFVLPWPVNLFILFLLFYRHSAFADMNYHFFLSTDACLHTCTFCMLIKEKSVFLSALLNRFVCLRIYIRFFKPFYFSILLWVSLFSSFVMYWSHFFSFPIKNQADKTTPFLVSLSF